MKGKYLDFDVRVRYVDTDQMGVVHHGNYMVWFEIGRTEFCRSRGCTYLDVERMGYRLMIIDGRCSRARRRSRITTGVASGERHE